MIEFETSIEEAPRGGAFVTIPPHVAESLGGGGRIPVQATFDGVEYRGSIVRMGGEPILGILKEIRDGLGKAVGDPVIVAVRRDDGERVVAIPQELQAALDANPEAKKTFGSLSYSHRREHAGYVAEAKKAATRERRADKTVEGLLK